MNHIWKRVVASLLALALIATLCVSCGGPSDEGVTVIIGQVTDVTGPGAPALIPISYVIDDLVRYSNEEGLLSGAKAKVVTYSTGFDPARDVPGYEWARQRGAEVVIAALPQTGEILKSFAGRDKVPLVTLSTTRNIVEPPEWAFAFNCLTSDEVRTLIDWISEEQWDYGQGKPKLGLVGWTDPLHLELEQVMGKYCQDNPGKFEWVGASLAPVGTMTWSGEIESLKGCDYIATGLGFNTFFKEFDAKGYTTTFIGPSVLPAYVGFYVDMFGWEPPLDGWLTTGVCTWWNEPGPLVDLAKELLNRYRSGQAEEIIYAGSGYLGVLHNMYAFLQILKKAIEDVGAENFDGQAFYNAAVQFRTAWEGYPEWSFTETKRYLIDDVQIFEWKASDRDLVRVSEWLPLVK